MIVNMIPDSGVELLNVDFPAGALSSNNDSHESFHFISLFCI